jgi:hypothetical protein
MATKWAGSSTSEHGKGSERRRVLLGLSPTGLGGVAFGVVAGGALAGPAGALIGAALGGAAGEALESAIPSRTNGTGQSGAGPHS